MIKSDALYRSFEAGFSNVARDSRLIRTRGKSSKYIAHTGAGPVSIWFRVNSKASAIPNHPGEFWPVLEAPPNVRGTRGADDGCISWYQYTTPDAISRILALQRAVLSKFVAQAEFEHDVLRQMRDASVPMVTEAATTPPEPRFPGTRLLYLDEADARSWGSEMAVETLNFLDTFSSQPETLSMYMWRVHWAAMEGGDAV